MRRHPLQERRRCLERHSVLSTFIPATRASRLIERLTALAAASHRRGSHRLTLTHLSLSSTKHRQCSREAAKATVLLQGVRP